MSDVACNVTHSQGDMAALCLWSSIVAELTYIRHGVPLEEYQLTRRDHHDQQISKQIRDAVERDAAKWRAEEEADPGLRARRAKTVHRALEMIASSQPADQEIMRWRVRLYCGHIAETRRHHTVTEPRMHGSSSMRCPECGVDPALIVAYEPIGLLAEPPPANHALPLQPKRFSRTQLEQRVAELEAEVRRLKSEDSGSERSLSQIRRPT